MNSDNTPKQIENISDNTSYSNIDQESNIQYSEPLIHTESESSKNKEIEFLDEINNTSTSQIEDLSSVNTSKLPGDLEIYPSNHD
ncbi:9604_t:CDS:2 [Dentiscutata erythropus]|uniref:9604_t:CDS:1 n=1 Tax=Dentiscutata erythropus TaxID=1348616 RepID=A0A9N9GM53_9GLOM|nr:9604_t:CDS:2 [Dentiscutata erythropus]